MKRRFSVDVCVLLPPAAVVANKAEAQCIVMDQQVLHRLPERRRIESLSNFEQQSLVPMVWIDEVFLKEPVLDRSEWNVSCDCSLLGLYYISGSHYRRQFRYRSILKDLIGSESKSCFACLSSRTNAENGITAKFE